MPMPAANMGRIYCYARNVHEYWGYSVIYLDERSSLKECLPQLSNSSCPKCATESRRRPLPAGRNKDTSVNAGRKYAMNSISRGGILTKNAGTIIKDKDILQNYLKTPVS